MAKVIKEILSRERVESLDSLHQHRHDTSERLKEEAHQNEQLLRPDGIFDVTNPEAQKGRVLPRAMLVRKIQKLNRNVWYEQSINYPDKGGLYFNDSVLGKQFICGFPHDRVNEFSLRIHISDVIPHPSLAPVWMDIQRASQQEPGWRSVLDKLIKYGLITEPQAEKEFKISQGRSSRYWQQSQESQVI